MCFHACCQCIITTEQMPARLRYMVETLPNNHSKTSSVRCWQEWSLKSYGLAGYLKPCSPWIYFFLLALQYLSSSVILISPWALMWVIFHLIGPPVNSDTCGASVHPCILKWIEWKELIILQLIFLQYSFADVFTPTYFLAIQHPKKVKPSWEQELI